jgi:hypothetical protein
MMISHSWSWREYRFEWQNAIYEGDYENKKGAWKRLSSVYSQGWQVQGRIQDGKRNGCGVYTYPDGTVERMAAISGLTTRGMVVAYF